MSGLRFHSPCFYPSSPSSATPEFGGLDRVPERPRPPPEAALDPRLRRHRPARSALLRPAPPRSAPYRAVPAQQPPAEGPGERPRVPGRAAPPPGGAGIGFHILPRSRAQRPWRRGECCCRAPVERREKGKRLCRSLGQWVWAGAGSHSRLGWTRGRASQRSR